MQVPRPSSLEAQVPWLSKVESHRRPARFQRFLARLAVLTAPLLVATLGALLVGVAPAGADPQLQSQGSSFAGVAIEQWVGQSSSLLGLNINFQITSSVYGLNAFAQNQVDFGASDIPYSSGQASSSPNQPYQYLPDVAGALAFMYNLTGIDGQRINSLVLNASTIEGIFSGTITYWDDPSIQALQPLATAENLPHIKIIPVVRSDPAGESYLLSDYLEHQDPGPFNSFLQQMSYSIGPTAQWPTPQGGVSYPNLPNISSMAPQNGADGIADYVSALSSDGAIGYLETAYAISHDFPVASVVNASGHAVQPTSFNDATALTKAILYADLTQNLTNVYTNPDSNAYPLSAYSYLVAPCNPALAAAQHFNCTGPGGSSPFPSDKGQELGQFVNFLACDGQVKMALLGYSPLPTNLVEEDFQAIGRLNGGVEPPPPTPANCANPYVTGALAPITGPTIVTSVSDVGSAGASQAANALASSSGSTGSASTGSSGSSGSSGSGSSATSARAGAHTVPTKPLSSPFGRLSDLQDTAGALGVMAWGPMGMWLLLFALLIVGPPLGYLLVRRRRWASAAGGAGAGGGPRPPDPGSGGPPGSEQRNGKVDVAIGGSAGVGGLGWTAGGGDR